MNRTNSSPQQSEIKRAFLQCVAADTPEEQAKLLKEIEVQDSVLALEVESLLRVMSANDQLNHLSHLAPSTSSDLQAQVCYPSVLKSLTRKHQSFPRIILRPQADEEPVSRLRTTEACSAAENTFSTGRYRFDGEIARGGMGAILKGRDTDLGRELAIKVLLDSHCKQPDAVERFIEEAQIGLEDAVTLAQQAIGFYPEQLNGHLSLALAYQAMGNVANAQTTFEKAIELNSQSAAAHHGLGQLDLASDKPKAAIAHFLTALSFDDENDELLFSLGMAYYRSDRFDETLATLENIAPNSNRRLHSQYLRSMAHARLGQEDVSRDVLEKTTAGNVKNSTDASELNKLLIEAKSVLQIQPPDK